MCWMYPFLRRRSKSQITLELMTILAGRLRVVVDLETQEVVSLPRKWREYDSRGLPLASGM